MPFDELAADEQSSASFGWRGFCGCKLLDLPQYGELDDGDIRPQHHRVPPDQWSCECGLRPLPHQQQLQFDDCADRLRQLAMPSDHLAADEYSCSFHFRLSFCRGELLHLPHDSRLDRRGVRSQRHRVYADRNAHVPDADPLRVVPCEQQLHAQFRGLLRMPPGGFSRHRNDWRNGAEPRHGRLSDHGFGLCDAATQSPRGPRAFSITAPPVSR